jgi:hypothetical protein
MLPRSVAWYRLWTAPVSKSTAINIYTQPGEAVAETPGYQAKAEPGVGMYEGAFACLRVLTGIPAACAKLQTFFDRSSGAESSPAASAWYTRTHAAEIQHIEK